MKKKKHLSASLYARVCMHVERAFSRALSPFSLTRRVEVKSSRVPVSLVVDIVCTGNPYSPAAFITGGQIIRWTRPRNLYRW